MSHLSKIFEEAPVKVQNRNGFDLSHTHSGSSKCGQLVPVLTKVLPPNSTISLGVQAEVNLPPFVAPFYGKIDFAIEGFIVPLSILYGGFKQFISNQEQSQFSDLNASLFQTSYDSTTKTQAVSTNALGRTNNGAWKQGYYIPQIDVISIARGDIAGWQSLYGDNENIYGYMGCNIDASGTTGVTTNLPISLMPALAYHKICDTFYRNTKLTKTWFAVNPNTNVYTDQNKKNVSLAWHSFYGPTDTTSDSDATKRYSGCQFTTAAELTFPDTVSVFSTRQRTYMRDYFTSAVPSPQQGGASVLQFSVTTSGGSGSGEFTINSLRMANALQKFLETNNLSGDYAEMVRNRWGVRPIDADFEEPHYLGRVVIPVYKHSVNKTDATTDDSTGSSNPFVQANLLGAQAANGGAAGDGSICQNFNVSCWSYLMCIASLYPHANYNRGVNRELTMTNLGEFPAPELQSVGMEEIKHYELSGVATSGNISTYLGTFGYIPRYSRFKYIDDHTSGELLPNRSLNQYQLQRSFGSTIPVLGTSFVEIAKSDLDNVLAVSTDEMGLSCWWEIYFKLHVVMPLADFCIPTLGELADTHTIKTTVGGSRL